MCSYVCYNIQMWLKSTVAGVKEEHWEIQFKFVVYVQYFVVIKFLCSLSKRAFLSSVDFDSSII